MGEKDRHKRPTIVFERDIYAYWGVIYMDWEGYNGKVGSGGLTFKELAKIGSNREKTLKV